MKHPFVNIAVQAARAAGNTIMRGLERLNVLHIKEKSPNDYVTEIDEQAEQDIISIIRKAYPEHSILGEESGELSGNEYQWIIDPLDGTRNFIHGFLHFAVSIAIACKGRIEHAVIYDPIRQELFTGSRGKGAQLNDRRIRVSPRATFKDCLLATGFASRHSENSIETYTNQVRAVLTECNDLRRTGSAVLDLAYVASGRLDGFWESGLKPWDIAAGSLLVKEAGGLVCDLSGSENYLKNGEIVAANPKILKRMLKIVGTP